MQPSGALTLNPIKKRRDPRPFITFDIESKDGESQRAGFTRPFLVGIYDGATYKTFKNDKATERHHWYDRAVERGGCIDKFMRHILGDCGKGRWISPYKNHDIYAHNLGGFDGLFLPAWLLKHQKEFSFRIIPTQARIQLLEVWRHNPSRNRSTPEARKRADAADRKAGGTWRFLDSFRIMPISLDAMAKTFGHGGKVEHDLDLPEEDPNWDIYLKGDCVKLWKSLQSYASLIRQMGGEIGMTSPATAIKMLRMSYIPEGMKIYRNAHFPDCPDAPSASLSEQQLKDKVAEQKTGNEGQCKGCAHKFFRSAYKGGRTEPIRRSGWGWYYDFNSSYPYSMKNDMPVGAMFVLDENEDFSEHIKAGRIGFVRCTVRIPKDCYLPPLAIELDGKLKFPGGTFSGTWDWVELQVLKTIGGEILHVEKSVWFEGKRFLNKFIDTLYALRDKSKKNYDAGKSATAKNMMNASFGKYGMANERVEMIVLKPFEPEPRDGRRPGEGKPQWSKRKHLESKGEWKDELAQKREERKKKKAKEAEEKGEMQWQVPDLQCDSGIYEHESLVRVRDTYVDAPYIIPQVAAHITALSRMLLWHAAFQVVSEGYKLYYMDTDSLMTDHPSLPESTALGGLKKEFPEQIFVFCYGPKMYYLEKKTPFAGAHEKTETTDHRGELTYRKACERTCPGCKKIYPNGNITEKPHIVQGKHETDEMGNRLCIKHCPGCANWKIMMKGVPFDMRVPQTIERLKAGETIRIRQLEKLGGIARRGLAGTPHMIVAKKSLKSKYDKREFVSDDDDADTRPLFIDSPEYLSDAFKRWCEKKRKIPKWLSSVLPKKPIHPQP